MLKIGYLGPKGTFSYEALIRYAKDMTYEAIDYNTINDMIDAVHEGILDEAIVPMENSLEGAINATMDMMATEVELKIKQEFVLEINECLLVKPDTKMQEIEAVLSHPQPLGQCRIYLNTHFPNAEIRSVYSTTTAASEVAKGDGRMAAVGSVMAAQIYGLEIAAQKIQDDSNNFTRFVVISKQDSERTGQDKTSIVFSTENKPGSLYRVLDIFSLWDINMTRIESRPAKNKLGKYIFFIDIYGHREDEDVRDALTMVQRKSSFYKFLGSYPQYK